MIEENIRTAVKNILSAEAIGDSELFFKALRGDASDRSYFRVSTENSSGKTYVLMKMKAGFNSCAEEITRSSKKIDELPFLNVQRYLKSLGSPVPDVTGFDEKAGIIVLEDLGDTSLHSLIGTLPKSKIEGYYSDLVEELVNIQVAGKPGFPGRYAGWSAARHRQKAPRPVPARRS